MHCCVQQQGQPWITKKEDNINIPPVSWIVTAVHVVYWEEYFTLSKCV